MPSFHLLQNYINIRKRQIRFSSDTLRAALAKSLWSEKKVFGVFDI